MPGASPNPGSWRGFNDEPHDLRNHISQHHNIRTIQKLYEVGRRDRGYLRIPRLTYHVAVVAKYMKPGKTSEHAYIIIDLLPYLV